MTHEQWISTIQRLPSDTEKRVVGTFRTENPVVGVASRLDEATRLHDAFCEMFPGRWTCQTFHNGVIAVRSCQPLRRADLATARTVLFGVHWCPIHAPVEQEGNEEDTPSHVAV